MMFAMAGLLHVGLARLSPAELCGFETWYRVNFGPDDSVVRNEMDVPDTEIVDGLPQ